MLRRIFSSLESIVSLASVASLSVAVVAVGKIATVAENEEAQEPPHESARNPFVCATCCDAIAATSAVYFMADRSFCSNRCRVVFAHVAL